MSQHELQCFFLERLGYLVELYESMDASWTIADRRLFFHALYSTYQDCGSIGLRPVAWAMIEELHRV